MTIPTERTRAVLETGRFLRELSRGKYHVPIKVREIAYRLERHFPSCSDLFMAAHGYGGFADPEDAINPLGVPPQVGPDDRVPMTAGQYKELLEIAERTPMSFRFDVEPWLEQWLDMVHPALGGATPRDVATRPDGYQVVRRVLLAVLDSAFL